MTEDFIRVSLKKNGIPPAGDLPAKLEIYLRLLGEWNEKMDLTAVEGEEEWLDKHFIDSLTVLKTGLIPDGTANLIDVGTGAGFPGMVLALARADLNVTLLDARQKRLDFLRAVSEAAGAENVRLIHGRAEEYARQGEFREKFDLAAARAVAPTNVLCELLLPFVKIGGKALFWKGPSLADELESGRKAAFLLGGKMGEAVLCPVAERGWEHVVLPVDKVRKTPGTYPRKAGTPQARPLP